MEGEPIYFNTSRLEEGGFSSSTPSALLLPSSLPSIQQMKFYFRQYLHHGGGELKRRLLAEAEKNDSCLLHVDLSDLKSYQHHIEEADLKCVDTPYCKKRQHAAPPDFAHQLVKVNVSLSLSPPLFLYLSVCRLSMHLSICLLLFFFTRGEERVLGNGTTEDAESRIFLVDRRL